MTATTDSRPGATGTPEASAAPPGGWEEPAPPAGSSTKVIDPDCRNGKHAPTCIGGPCECLCHTGADPTDPAVDISAAPPLSADTRADLALLLQPARRKA